MPPIADRQLVSSGSPHEPTIGSSRAVRVGGVRAAATMVIEAEAVLS